MAFEAPAARHRYQFAHILRGPAALLVVISHCLGLFWTHQPAVARLLGADPHPAATPTVIAQIAEYQGVIGQAGVGVFFILSGFVIALSMDGAPKANFLVRRLLRIYPVYIAGFSVTLASIWLTSRHFGQGFPHSIGTVLMHYTLLPRAWLGWTMIDGVSWTLEIELIFYIFMALAGRCILRHGFLVLLGSMLAFFIVGVVLQFAFGRILLSRQFSNVPLLLLGVGVFLHMQGRLASNRLYVLLVVGLCSSVAVTLLDARAAQNVLQSSIGYLIGICMFLLAYRSRNQLERPLSFLTHLSDLSFPLYVSHVFIVYGVLYSSLRIGLSPWVGIALATMSSYIVAAVLHRGIERPMLDLARRLR